MAIDPVTHRRRSVRLFGYDYSQPGRYFVTICTKGMCSIFGTVSDGRMRLSPAGRIVERCWKQVPRHFPGLELDEWVVMPNHLHGILSIADVGARHSGKVGARHGVPNREKFSHPVSGSLATAIRLFKQAATRRIRDVGAFHGVPRQVWQRNFYEHIIRDDCELGKIREYILTNPLHWTTDRYNPERGVLLLDETGTLMPWEE